MAISVYRIPITTAIIECITDSKNRTIAEIKHILAEAGAKFAESGSVRWNFDHPAQGESWTPKATHSISDTAREKIARVPRALEAHDDVQKITTNST